ncbi:hypothetical protein GCM10025884_08800 [Leuconostoc gelidum subsp. gelidum]|nr:hypothetical protein GCM10025884_08800 [Leuconostoc gelidum subsp. gelidum]
MRGPLNKANGDNIMIAIANTVGLLGTIEFNTPLNLAAFLTAVALNIVKNNSIIISPEISVMAIFIELLIMFNAWLYVFKFPVINKTIAIASINAGIGSHPNTKFMKTGKTGITYEIFGTLNLFCD